VAKQIPGALGSPGWPRVAGQVTERIGRTGIEYVYYVDGRGYVGDRVRFSPTPPFPVGISRQRCVLLPEAVGACRYALNDSVTVSYDPADPRRSVLEPGLPLRLAGWLVARLALLAPLALDLRHGTAG
jgi:hypothetical protein